MDQLCHAGSTRFHSHNASLCHSPSPSVNPLTIGMTHLITLIFVCVRVCVCFCVCVCFSHPLQSSIGASCLLFFMHPYFHLSVCGPFLILSCPYDLCSQTEERLRACRPATDLPAPHLHQHQWEQSTGWAPHPSPASEPIRKQNPILERFTKKGTTFLRTKLIHNFLLIRLVAFTTKKITFQ